LPNRRCRVIEIVKPVPKPKPKPVPKPKPKPEPEPDPDPSPFGNYTLPVRPLPIGPDRM
jgi:protein TonB